MEQVYQNGPLHQKQRDRSVILTKWDRDEHPQCLITAHAFISIDFSSIAVSVVLTVICTEEPVLVELGCKFAR